VRAAPAVSCAKLCEETHTSIQVQRKHSGIPRAMALRLMPCSPRRRIRLVTVAAGLMANPIRLDRISRRQLDTSNGCQNHTVLPYALASFVLRAVNRSRFDLALRSPCAPTPSRPPHPIPRFVTIMIRPSCRERMGRTCRDDLPDGGRGNIFRSRAGQVFSDLPVGCKRAYEMSGTNEFGFGRTC
jgi:hypothetical protein